MSADKYEQLDVPELKPITDKLEGLRKWDVVHNSLLNIEIGILSYEPIETQYGDALLAKCLIKGEEKMVLMGGEVLCQQLILLKDELPFLTTIVKINNYYEFS